MSQLSLPIRYGKPPQFSFKKVGDKNQEQVGFEIHSFRVHDMQKLKKPKRLTGIKPSFSVDYIPRKCRNQVFVLGDDVWVKHRDYLSPHVETKGGRFRVDGVDFERCDDFGMPLEGRIALRGMNPRSLKSFGYPDCWGEIVSRQEAWIRVRNLIPAIERNFIRTAMKVITAQEEYHKLPQGELWCGEMERMWEAICKRLFETGGLT